LAEGPIALCEVQGYAYAAKVAGASLAQVLGRPEAAARWRRSAEKLKAAFARVYWCEELSTYALALDGEKRPCRVRTSNAGQCLWTGIAEDEHARQVAKTIMNQESFSGWGIRTVAESEVRYNPISYHNGSVWPHDTALIAQGLARYGFRAEVIELFSGLFETCTAADLRRLPELFCGFARRPGRSPVRYPVACSPQSWAAGAVFMLLGASLGLSISIRAAENEIRLYHPVLPPWLQEVTLTNLILGSAWVDVSLKRDARGVSALVLKREGSVKVVTIK
jgi:glycogen debranching enzyme